LYPKNQKRKRRKKRKKVPEPNFSLKGLPTFNRQDTDPMDFEIQEKITSGSQRFAQLISVVH